jgi:hypothetical protein
MKLVSLSTPLPDPCGSSPGLGGLLTAVELVEEVGVVLEAHHQVRMVGR